MTILSIDLETRSRCDLLKEGLYRYARHPSTKILIFGYAVDDNPVQIWLPHAQAKAPAELRDALLDPHVEKRAWNCPFESEIIEHTFKRPTANWTDTMVRALYFSLPAALAYAGPAIGIPEDQCKSPEGKKLINLFSIPNKFGEFNDHLSHPVEFERFITYCERDVEVERRIANMLRAYAPPQSEWGLWALDQKINKRGLPVDTEFVSHALRMAEEEKARLLTILRRETGLAKPTSQAPFLGYAKSQGYPYGDLTKSSIAKAVRNNELPPHLAHLLALRGDATRTSTAKYASILDKTLDGRIYNTMQFYGAGRTGRWAGRNPQVQNFPRPNPALEGHEERVTELVRDYQYDDILMEFGGAMTPLASLTRSSFRAPDGSTFYVSDLNAIENRVLGWVSGCTAILDVFRNERDPYKDFGARMFNKPYEDITKPERTISKPAVLGCFAEDTKVLTKRGWVRIIDVTLSDYVHDGYEWTTHGGVVAQGVKETINLGGVRCTAEHKILTGAGWTAALRVALDDNLYRSALSLASGMLSRSSALRVVERHGTNTCAAVLAELKRLSRLSIWSAAEQSLVSPAPTDAYTPANPASLCRTGYPKASTTDWLGVSTASEHGVLAARAPTRTMPDVVSNAALPIQNTSFLRALLYVATNKYGLKLTASTTTGTMKRGTYGSALAGNNAAINGERGLSNTTARSTTPQIFTRFSAPPIGVRLRSRGKSVLGYLLRKLSQTKTLVKEPTFDIINAGARSRFTILTKDGPLIVHNCGYALGGGDEVPNPNGDIIKTGLWGYAEAMGIQLTREQSHRSVQVFRASFPEVVRYWARLRDAAMSAIEQGGTVTVGAVVFEMRKGVMLLHLPSGRTLHYVKPRIELVKRKFPNGDVVSSPTITYEGLNLAKKWVRTTTHGGKLTENICQAIARDVLAAGLIAADKKGFDIVLHAHDEIVCEVPLASALTLQDLSDCMTAPLPWAVGLPLAAAGEITPIYKK